MNFYLPNDFVLAQHFAQQQQQGEKRQATKGERKPHQWRPSIDIDSSPEAVTLLVDLPGVLLKDISVEVDTDKQVLTISGVRTTPAPKGKLLRRERSAGAFSRVFEIEHDLDADRILATHDNGVLQVTLPRKPKQQPRRIPIATEPAPVVEEEKPAAAEDKQEEEEQPATPTAEVTADKPDAEWADLKE